MSLISMPLRRVGRVVAGHVRRLRLALNALAGQVRAAIARVIGQATGEAVRDAIGVILDGPPGRPPADDYSQEREGLWGQDRPRPSWPGHAHDPCARDPEDDEPNRYREQDHACYDDEPSGPATTTSGSSAWSRAVAAGCQAASWWLGRHPGPFSLVAAAAVGVAAGVTALLGGRFVAAGSAVAMSALGVLALADAARSAAGLADQAMR